jgi:hypothetical protein
LLAAAGVIVALRGKRRRGSFSDHADTNALAEAHIVAGDDLEQGALGSQSPLSATG